jgi:hypothetical protein
MPLLALLASAVGLLPAAPAEAETPAPVGAAAVAKPFPYVVPSVTQAKYDPRAVTPSPMSPVMNQGNVPACDIFSLLATAEGGSSQRRCRQ